jgi:predicted dehydrogenase
VAAAAAAGKHVFCEKPLALTVVDARAMFEACRKARVKLAVGHNRRFWPAMQALERIAGSGQLGRILHIEGHNSNENSNRVLGGWRTSADESPGGGFTGAGLHVLDAFVHLLGPVRQVHAQLRTYREQIPPLDAMSALYEFTDGTSGMLATLRATPFYWRVHLFGTLGSAEVLGETELVLRMTGREPQRLTFEPQDSVRAELEAFADAIEGRADYPVSEREVLATLAAFEATLASLRSGAAVATASSS